MLGAIIGDVIGSVYEWDRIKTTDFPLFCDKSKFTDDTVMTIATAQAIIDQTPYADAYRKFGRFYQGRGYGGRFRKWLEAETIQPPYDSWGNGSAMRVAPVGWAFNTLDTIMSEAKKSAECTHNHPEGIKGAQATAVAIWMSRNHCSKEEIRHYVTEIFGYNLARTVEEIRPDYKFTEECSQTVPQALIAFFDSKNFEETIRLSVSLGGDSDTLACIAGSVAEAFYGCFSIPMEIWAPVANKLPVEFHSIIRQFLHLVVCRYGAVL